MIKGEIYLANLNFNCGINKVRPVVIVSSAKVLLKTKNTMVQVIPITDLYNKKQLLSSHIRLEGFGLSKPSVALVEQITTISKNLLIKRLGCLDNKTLIEINQKIKRQLATEDLCNFNDMGELLKMVSNVGIKQYEILRNKMYASFLEEDFTICKDLCNKLITLSKNNNKKYYTWCGYYVLAKIDIKEKTNNLTNVEYAVKYSDENTINLSIWAMAKVLEDIDIKKSLNLYIKLANSYKNQLRDVERLSILTNIVVLKKDTTKAKYLIRILDKIKADWNYREDKDSFIDSIKNDLNSILAV